MGLNIIPIIVLLILLCVCVCVCVCLCSRDCIEWNILPHVDEGLKRKSALLQGRFTGDPSYVNEHTVTQRVGEGDNTHVETSTVSEKLPLFLMFVSACVIVTLVI